MKRGRDRGRANRSRSDRPDAGGCAYGFDPPPGQPRCQPHRPDNRQPDPPAPARTGACRHGHKAQSTHRNADPSAWPEMASRTTCYGQPPAPRTSILPPRRTAARPALALDCPVTQGDAVGRRSLRWPPGPP